MSIPQRPQAKCHVARDGKVLGSYDSEQIRDLLAARELRPDDHFYKESTATWHPLAEWNMSQAAESAPEQRTIPSRKKTSPPKSEDSGGSRSERRGGRGKGKSRQPQGPALGGWIACLFALGAAAGLWAWSQNLSNSLQISGEKIREQSALIDHLETQIDLLSELTPPGRVRAIITYEPGPDKVAIVSGVTVQLYSRADVDAALATLGDSTPTSNEELFRDFAKIQNNLPTPMEISITQSNGRIDMAIPVPGEYVLLASAAKAGPKGQIEMYWMQGFQSTDEPSELIVMSEKNAITLANPRLMITDAGNSLRGN